MPIQTTECACVACATKFLESQQTHLQTPKADSGTNPLSAVPLPSDCHICASNPKTGIALGNLSRSPPNQQVFEDHVAKFPVPLDANQPPKKSLGEWYQASVSTVVLEGDALPHPEPQLVEVVQGYHVLHPQQPTASAPRTCNQLKHVKVTLTIISASCKKQTINIVFQKCLTVSESSGCLATGLHWSFVASACRRAPATEAASNVKARLHKQLHKVPQNSKPSLVWTPKPQLVEAVHGYYVLPPHQEDACN